MELLTEDIRKTLPPLGDGDGNAYVKFFLPGTQWTWYASEFDGEDLFFGLVIGQEKEYGYFSLSELAELQAPCRVLIDHKRHIFPTNVERETFFTPKLLVDLYKEV